MSNIAILPANTEDLLDAVYRFRYRIYVELMGRRQLYADHSRKIIIEPYDLGATIFVALKDGQVVGTVRGNMSSDPSMAYYSKIYKIDQYDFPSPSRIGITTKLMIHPSLKSTGIAIRLLREFALDGYYKGLTVNFMDCNRPLIPLFERLGYFSYCGWRFHKEFGTIRPMLMAVDTVSYFRSIGSFFADLAAIASVRDGQYGGYDFLRRYVNNPPAIIEPLPRPDTVRLPTQIMDLA